MIAVKDGGDWSLKPTAVTVTALQRATCWFSRKSLGKSPQDYQLYLHKH